MRLAVALASSAALASAAFAAEWLPPAAFAPPPESLHVQDGSVRFVAKGYVYETADAGETWTIEKVRERTRQATRQAPLLAARRIHSDTSGVQTIFQSVLDRDAARLVITRFQEGRMTPIEELVLYDRWVVGAAERRASRRKLLLAPQDTLAKAPSPAAALLTAVETAGSSLWLGVGWQDAQRRGVGAVVRHDLSTGVSRVFRPVALETGSVVRLAVTPDAVWIALDPPGGDTTRGTRLLRFDPVSEETADMTAQLAPRTARITALATRSDTIWVAAGDVVARTTETGKTWRRWRVVPKVRLALREPISNLPGRPSTRALSSGSYEVLGGSSDSLLVGMPDGAEGWLAPGGGSGAEIVLRKTPHAAGEVAASFPARVPWRSLTLRTADGWTRARVLAGWIARRGRGPEPAIAEERTETTRN